jgi:hypothetical protein
MLELPLCFPWQHLFGVIMSIRGLSIDNRFFFFLIYYNFYIKILGRTNQRIFFLAASYWARDVIFVVTEHEQLGMEAWLEAYHYTSSGSNSIDFGQLDARAGAIQVRIYCSRVNQLIHSTNMHIRLQSI